MPVLKERHLPGECRQSVTELLKETYGYDGFRNLEIYDDLFKKQGYSLYLSGTTG